MLLTNRNIHVTHLNMLLVRLYQEEQMDGSSSGVKWRCPNIHDLMEILKKLQIELILDNVFDKRMSKVEDLSVVQLREECVGLSLDKKGKKVNINTY